VRELYPTPLRTRDKRSTSICFNDVCSQARWQANLFSSACLGSLFTSVCRQGRERVAHILQFAKFGDHAAACSARSIDRSCEHSASNACPDYRQQRVCECCHANLCGTGRFLLITISTIYILGIPYASHMRIYDSYISYIDSILALCYHIRLASRSCDMSKHNQILPT
jgi:hypothetical protein